jgi:hexokinase
MSASKSASRPSWSTLSQGTKVIGASVFAVAAVAAGIWAWRRTQKNSSITSNQANGEQVVNGCFFPTLVQIDTAFLELSEMLEVDREDMEKVADGIHEAMSSGLRPSSDSALKMLPTYVDKIDVKAEGQEVLALDMGGTNLRVMRVQINPDGHAVILNVSRHSIPEQFMIGSGAALFDFIAECVLEEIGTGDDSLPLGFTFSFPLQQEAINRGKLVEWTKGFTASDVEGRDVAELLNSSFKAAGRDIRVTALVNDTVGTMLTGAFATQDENTLIGLILGTGSNACYMESAENIAKWQHGPIETGRMIINIEWGAYDSPIYSNLPHTKYDIELDQMSLNPGKQHYEKMLSGMYLGELVRLILQDYCACINLFGGQTSSIISTPHRFGSHFMSQIDADGSSDLAGVCAVLRSIGIQETTLPVRQFVKNVCHLVAMRSARLAAAGILAIVRQMGRTHQPVNVAIDGSVFELYPGYQDQMRSSLKELGIAQVTLTLAKDGSGLGAALTAAIMGPAPASD